MSLLSATPSRLLSGTLMRLSKMCLVVAIGLLPINGKILAETKPASEYQIKAVFLFNFTQFVEWPSDAFPDTETPLVIGVLGEDPFGAYLDDAVAGEKSNNRRLVVERYRRMNDVKLCHILFISRSEVDRLEQILIALNGRQILTVSDTDGFAGRGGMIRFVTERNKIRLKINLEAAKAAKLTISSKLLRPADIVTTGKE